MSGRALLAALLLLAPPAVHVQGEPRDTLGLRPAFRLIDRFVAQAMLQENTPGLALALVDRRGLITVRSYGYADLERRLPVTPQTRFQIGSISKSFTAIALLQLADEGRFDLHREPVAMEPLAREVLETAVILGEEAGLDVSMPIVEPGVVMGDRPRLRQLMLNLITNAIKYTPRGGRVELTLSRRVDGIGFSVRDTGIGISAADLSYVFERFWRADRARSRRPAVDGTRWTDDRGGFGLGLAISQYIAQAHGGSLTVTSRLGRGSLFTLLLPVVEENGSAVSPANSPSTNPFAMPPS